MSASRSKWAASKSRSSRIALAAASRRAAACSASPGGSNKQFLILLANTRLDLPNPQALTTQQVLLLLICDSNGHCRSSANLICSSGSAIGPLSYLSGRPYGFAACRGIHVLRYIASWLTILSEEGLWFAGP